MKEVIVTFRDGKQVTYTYSILGLLLTDTDVFCIKDKETGTIIFYR